MEIPNFKSICLSENGWDSTLFQLEMENSEWSQRYFVAVGSYDNDFCMAPNTSAPQTTNSLWNRRHIYFDFHTVCIHMFSYSCCSSVDFTKICFPKERLQMEPRSSAAVMWVLACFTPGMCNVHRFTTISWRMALIKTKFYFVSEFGLFGIDGRASFGNQSYYSEMLFVLTRRSYVYSHLCVCKLLFYDFH